MIKIKLLIFGAGKNTENMIPLINKLQYNIVGICDSDSSKIGCLINGYKVLCKEEAINICKRDHDVIMVNGAMNNSARNEIDHIIKVDFPKATEVMSGLDIRRDAYKLELNEVHANMRYDWKVDLVDQFSRWVDSYDDELNYWLSNVVSNNSPETKRYKELICTDKSKNLFRA